MAKLAIAVLMAAFLLPGCSDSDAIPEGDPSKTFNNDMRGYKVWPGVLIGLERSAFWLQRAVKGYRKTKESDLPATVNIVRTTNTCSFRRPAADEIIANVHVGRGNVKTPVYAVSKKTLVERTKDWIDIYKRDGEKPGSQASPSGDTLRAVDVVVTETSKPVYLILQNEWSAILWNVHAAPGVVLAHVAVLGNGAVGVANLEETVPVEFMNSQALEQCNVTPVRQPADHWIFVQRAKKGNSRELKDALAKNRKLHSNYSRWFTKKFGTYSEAEIIGLQEASHFLVGPLPETLDQRVSYNSLKGANVKVAFESFVFAGSKSNFKEQHGKLVRQHATRMAGGDLQSIAAGK